MAMRRTDTGAMTLTFDKFWAWLQFHANCILRAGTPEVLLFDHDDYHWHLAAEEDGVLIVQLVRGKELVAELVLVSNDISYVQVEPAENEEFLFECVIETEANREVAYHFVLPHGYDEAEQSSSSKRWTH